MTQTFATKTHRAGLIAAALALAIGAAAATGEAKPIRIVERHGDVHITRPTRWRNAHYQIHGNLIFDAGGALTADNCTVELMSAYSRQFNAYWRGGKLATRNCTLGGSMDGNVVSQVNLELADGEWDATDTTVRYCSGIVVGGERLGTLRAKRLIAGPHPDSVIMGGRGDVLVEDSTYAISLTSYADAGGGGGVLDFPRNKQVNQVYDGRNIPGARYRLRLARTKVSLWFLFINSVSMDAKPVEIILRDCPGLIPSFMGGNLKGRIRLPSMWPANEKDAAVRIGNVTLRTLGKATSVYCWGLYLWGAQTDLTVEGHTMICELMLWDGKVALLGADGTYESATTATTIEVGADGKPERPELLLRNIEIGRFARGDQVVGQITAHGNGRVRIEHARCAPLKLITKGEGTITLQDIRKEGAITVRQEGGAIEGAGQQP